MHSRHFLIYCVMILHFTIQWKPQILTSLAGVPTSWISNCLTCKVLAMFAMVFILISSLYLFSIVGVHYMAFDPHPDLLLGEILHIFGDIDICALWHRFMVKYRFNIKVHLQYKFSISKWPPPPPIKLFRKFIPYCWNVLYPYFECYLCIIIVCAIFEIWGRILQKWYLVKKCQNIGVRASPLPLDLGNARKKTFIFHGRCSLSCPSFLAN